MEHTKEWNLKEKNKELIRFIENQIERKRVEITNLNMKLIELIIDKQHLESVIKQLNIDKLSGGIGQ